MKKILIAGDSFAANWRLKYNGTGWVNHLENDYDVKNIAQAGVSEYKIMRQLLTQDLDDYDKIIVSHTSAYRIPIAEHPIHKDDILHKNCDLIFSDVSEHVENPTMKIAYDFYTNIFHTDYFVYTNELIFKDIRNMSDKMIHITFFDDFYNFYDEHILHLENIFQNHKGQMNHMDKIGNEKVYKIIKKQIDE